MRRAVLCDLVRPAVCVAVRRQQALDDGDVPACARDLQAGSGVVVVSMMVYQLWIGTRCQQAGDDVDVTMAARFVQGCAGIGIGLGAGGEESVNHCSIPALAGGGQGAPVLQQRIHVGSGQG